MGDVLKELGIDFNLYKEHKDSKVKLIIEKEGKKLLVEGRLKELLILVVMMFKYGGDESLAESTNRMAGKRKG